MEELSKAERDFWHSEAARWEIIAEDAERAAEYARKQRLRALGKLGMVKMENEDANE